MPQIEDHLGSYGVGVKKPKPAPSENIQILDIDSTPLALQAAKSRLASFTQSPKLKLMKAAAAPSPCLEVMQLGVETFTSNRMTNVIDSTCKVMLSVRGDAS